MDVPIVYCASFCIMGMSGDKPVGVLSHCLRARNGGKRCYSEKHRQVRETTMCIDNFADLDVTADDRLEHYLRNKRNWYKSST